VTDALLGIRDLRVEFRSDAGVTPVLTGVTLEVGRGETVGLVGETGSGKSLTALAILGLVPAPGRVTAGAVRFQGRDLLRLPSREMRAIRGAGISMIFQEPMTSLDPSFPIGRQMREVLATHLGLRGNAATRRAVELLERVRMPHAARVLGQYPFELSGGMQQRVMIAMAISCRPALLIADEATTALDVTVQAQVLSLLKQLQHEMGMSILYITHDMGVVAETCDRVYLMYGGRIVESAAAEAIFHDPRHPYTRGLLAAIPRLDGELSRLQAIPEGSPGVRTSAAGCGFAGRCPHVMPRCRSENPALLEVAADHRTACFLYGS
jgi:peptide/nickel transport system ATP-binding protein